MADDAEEARARRGGEETGNWSKNQQQVILIWIETGDHYDQNQQQMIRIIIIMLKIDDNRTSPSWKSRALASNWP